MTMAQSKSGFLLLSDNESNVKHRLLAVAYTEVSEPFVLFYNGAMGIWKKPCAVVRLRDCIVRDQDKLTFIVTPGGERIGGGPGFLAFTAESSTEKDSWVAVFKTFQQKKNTHEIRERRKRCVPKLAAIEETEEKEQLQRRISLLRV
ncbi:predicted protein [Nematostella vectensis]|uniref:PH domain-containing protein n=1 Tax=Nematostella vectensis TaxID=45351 RepID=A7SE94_NEMVE|nr:predicted protein [Nematostella vectensis]|eukprot:XP_001630059.1 predicted protein [Nematostella vectensis]